MHVENGNVLQFNDEFYAFYEINENEWLLKNDDGVHGYVQKKHEYDARYEHDECWNKNDGRVYAHDDEMYAHDDDGLHENDEIVKNCTNEKDDGWYDDVHERDGDDDEKTLHSRLVNIMSHGAYSLFEPTEMIEENKGYFRSIFTNYLTILYFLSAFWYNVLPFLWPDKNTFNYLLKKVVDSCF